jgi:hypothetical protein
MKHTILVFLGVCLLMTLGCSQRPSVDVSGEWTVQWHSPEQEHLFPFVMDLTHGRGRRVAGTAVAEQQDETIRVSGLLSGNGITFALSNDRGAIDFRGIVEQDRMNGTFDHKGLTGKWSAERQQPQNKKVDPIN